MLRQAILAFAILFLAVDATQANNNLFLPGDAYFPTELTGEELEKLNASPRQPPVFKYSALGGYSMAFCGYAGYGVAQVEQLDEPFVQNLRLAYKRVIKNESSRSTNRQRRSENGRTLRMLLYPKVHDGPQFILGLRYNENWKAETVKFGHRPSQVRECHLLNDKRARIISGRQAAKVPALPAKLPDVKLNPYGETEKPILIDVPIRVFVIGSSSLDEQLHPKPFQTYRLVADSTGVWEQWYEDEGWVTEIARE